MRRHIVVAALSLALSAGCSAQRLAELETDLHGAAVVTAGVAATIKTTAQTNPDAVAELGTLARKLATKAGVTPEDQAVLTQTVTIENVDKIHAVATRIAGATVTGGSP